MNTATVAYSLMMFSVDGMVLASALVILLSLNEIWRRWSLKVGYRSGYYPTHGHVQMFGFAIIRKYMTGVSGTTIAVGLISAIFLLLFSAPALNGIRKMTPEEFLQDFQKFQQERHGTAPASQQPDPR
jgi:hypothetical protein